MCKQWIPGYFSLRPCGLGMRLAQAHPNTEHRIVIVAIVYVYNGNIVRVPTGPFVLSSDPFVNIGC